MNIVCSTDNNFVQHCSIMLVSLLINNSDVEIFILTEGLTPENEQIIRDEVCQHGGVVHFCIVDTAIVEKFPMPTLPGLSHISRATYYRLLISDLLPLDVHKAIYLDCDIIVNHSIKELWDLDLSEYALAASIQVGHGYEAERLGYPISFGYFNAGVNVINLDYFRKNHISNNLLNYISSNYSRIKFHDQDTLNAVLFDKCLHIPPQWNMTSLAYAPQLNKRGDSKNGMVINDYKEEKENIRKHKANPIILHYVSRPKPWQKNCVHPLYYLYYEYARKTIHYKDIPKQNSFIRYLAVFVYQLRSLITVVNQTIHKTDPSRL